MTRFVSDYAVWILLAMSLSAAAVLVWLELKQQLHDMRDEQRGPRGGGIHVGGPPTRVH